MPATAKFLHAVAALPQGAVVLPGLDTDLDDEAWRSIGGVRDAQGKFTSPPASNHPQYAMHALLQRFGIKRGDVEILGQPAPQGRDVLVSEAMRPSNATAQWHDRLERARYRREDRRAAWTNLAVIEARNPEMEALAIAVAMREARHLDKSAALVTPDRALARRVIGGARPLESRLRRFRRRRADGDAGRHFRAARGGSGGKTGWSRRRCWRCSKHPLCRLGGAPGAFKDAIEALELALLRGTRPQAGSEWPRAAISRASATSCASSTRGEPSSLHRCRAEGCGCETRTRSGASADRGLAGRAGAAGKPCCLEAA